MRAVPHTASVEPCLLQWTAAWALRDERVKRWLIYDRVGAFLLLKYLASYWCSVLFLSSVTIARLHVCFDIALVTLRADGIPCVSLHRGWRDRSDGQSAGGLAVRGCLPGQKEKDTEAERWILCLFLSREQSQGRAVSPLILLKSYVTTTALWAIIVPEFPKFA